MRATAKHVAAQGEFLRIVTPRTWGIGLIVARPLFALNRLMADKLYDPIQRDPRDPVQEVPEPPVVSDSDPDLSSLSLSRHRTKLSTHRTYLSEHRTGLSEKRTSLSERRSEMSSRRTGLSFQRTRLSADRTLMSVIRTSLSLISFGFTIYQFFRTLESARVIPGGSASASALGQALLWLGVGMITLGIVYHLQFMAGLRRERAAMAASGDIHGDSAFPVSMTLIVAVLLLFVGLAAVSSIIFRWPS